jgi:hypothetical protein
MSATSFSTSPFSHYAIPVFSATDCYFWNCPWYAVSPNLPNVSNAFILAHPGEDHVFSRDEVAVRRVSTHFFALTMFLPNDA